jgi:hypothetical protein
VAEGRPRLAVTGLLRLCALCRAYWAGGRRGRGLGRCWGVDAVDAPVARCGQPGGAVADCLSVAHPMLSTVPVDATVPEKLRTRERRRGMTE